MKRSSGVKVIIASALLIIGLPLFFMLGIPAILEAEPGTFLYDLGGILIWIGPFFALLLGLHFMIKVGKGVDRRYRQISPNMEVTLLFETGERRDVFIPRNQNPREFIANWMQGNPSNKVIAVINRETGNELWLE